LNNSIYPMTGIQFTFRTIILIILFSVASFNSWSTEPENRNTCQHRHSGQKEIPLLPPFNAANSRSDTINIEHYQINLNITDFTNESVHGSCRITFTDLVGGTQDLFLDLLEMQVDSIVAVSGPLTYAYDDTLLQINLSNALTLGETSWVEVYYQGSPQGDASGWGGFYFQSGHAFNLGVGFAANPHNYGRVWFPCFDNFVERATFAFNITTSGGKMAACNGALISQDTLVGDTITWHWEMAEEIPSYLACVAVADYTVVNQVHAGINNIIPIQLFARASDTTNLKNSFANLGAAIEAFETRYGPYQWNKVGYSLVPFNSGAMEHASNIAYPQFAANGTLNSETLMAHELGHMWWGNLVTCETAEDMWINEGMATYMEKLFLEHVYGWEASIEAVNSEHLNVLRYAHHLEDEFRAVSGIPHEYTYGDHVYDKGGLVAHTLRSYMGDQAFFSSMSDFLTNNAFTHVSSEDLRDQLSTSSNIDLNDFFEDWVFNPGFPHFAVDSFHVTQGTALMDVEVFVHQKLTGAPALYDNVPLELTFMSSDWILNTQQIIMSDEYDSFTFSLPFAPAYTTLNINNRISHAISDNQVTIKAPGAFNMTRALMEVDVHEVADSAFLRIEHNWTWPDPIKDVSKLKMALSPNRYWRVDGIFPAGLEMGATLFYDGKESSGNGGFLDNDLITDIEDSLHLLYREDPSKDWRVFEYYSINDLNNSTDKFGVVTIDSLFKGEYVLANQDQSVGLQQLKSSGEVIKVYPNPADDRIVFDYSDLDQQPTQLLIYNVQGQLIRQQNLVGSNNRFEMSTDGMSEGSYVYLLKHSTGVVSNQFVVQRN